MIPDYCIREDREEDVIWRRKDTGVLFKDHQDCHKCILKVKKDDLLLERVQYFEKLEHKHVQRIYHFELIKDHYYIVAELLDVTLRGFLQEKRKKSDIKYEITLKEIRTIIDSLINGYEEFSKNGWTYKALTPSFICSYDLTIWKFSLTSCAITRHNFCPLLSEWNFLPPENRIKVENLKEADIYMLGQIIVHIITYEIKPLSETTIEFLDWMDIQSNYSQEYLTEITEFLRIAQNMVHVQPKDRVAWEKVKSLLMIDPTLSLAFTHTKSSQNLIAFEQTTGGLDQASNNLIQGLQDELSRQQLVTEIRDSNEKITRGAARHHKQVQTEKQEAVAVEVIRYRNKSRGRSQDRKLQLYDGKKSRAEQILKISCEKIKLIVLLLEKIQHTKLVDQKKIIEALQHLQFFKSQPVLNCLRNKPRQLADEAELDRDNFEKEVGEFCEKNRESTYAILQTALAAREPAPNPNYLCAEDCFNFLGQYWTLILQEKNDHLLKIYVTVFTMDIVYPLWRYSTILYGKILPSS